MIVCANPGEIVFREFNTLDCSGDEWEEVMHISNGQCQVFHEEHDGEEFTMWLHVHWDGACQPESTQEPTDPFHFDFSMADMDTSSFASTHHATSFWMESTEHSTSPSSMADMHTSDFGSSFYTSHMHTSFVDHSSTTFPTFDPTALTTPNPATDHPSQPDFSMMDYDETSMGMFDSTLMHPDMMDPNMIGMYDPNMMSSFDVKHDDFSMEEDFSMEDYGSMDMYNFDPNMPEMEMAAEMNPLTYTDFSKPAVQAVAIGSALLFSATIFCWMMRAAERRKQTTYQRLLLDAEDDEI